MRKGFEERNNIDHIRLIAMTAKQMQRRQDRRARRVEKLEAMMKRAMHKVLKWENEIQYLKDMIDRE